MKKVYQHIVTYLITFSLLTSSFGVTFYYHHCNTENLTYKSIFGKISCDHDSNDLSNNQYTDQKFTNQCCTHEETDENNSCTIDDATVTETHSPVYQANCCIDTQVTKKLNSQFVQVDNNNKIIKPQETKIYIEKADPLQKIIQSTKNFLNKRIIKPIKKLIILIQIITNFSKNQDKEKPSY